MHVGSIPCGSARGPDDPPAAGRDGNARRPRRRPSTPALRKRKRVVCPALPAWMADMPIDPPVDAFR
jgi:hypothetical protein